MSARERQPLLTLSVASQCFTHALGGALVSPYADPRCCCSKRIWSHQFDTHASGCRCRHSRASHQRWPPLGAGRHLSCSVPVARPAHPPLRFPTFLAATNADRECARRVCVHCLLWVFVLPRVQVAVVGVAAVRVAAWYRQRSS